MYIKIRKKNKKKPEISAKRFYIIIYMDNGSALNVNVQVYMVESNRIFMLFSR